MDIPEEGEVAAAGKSMRAFQIKIKWASSVNITDIQAYNACALDPPNEILLSCSQFRAYTIVSYNIIRRSRH